MLDLVTAVAYGGATAEFSAVPRWCRDYGGRRGDSSHLYDVPQQALPFDFIFLQADVGDLLPLNFQFPPFYSVDIFS